MKAGLLAVVTNISSLIQVAIKNHEVEYIINNENSLVTESLKDKITLLNKCIQLN